MKKIFLLLLLFIAIIGCNHQEKNNKITTIKFHQEIPEISIVDLDIEGLSPVDFHCFSGILTDNKAIIGELFGCRTTADVFNSTEGFQQGLNQMVFDFGDYNTIIIGGGTESPSLTGAEFVKIKPQIRGVIGGTGKYMGARGQLTTIRNDDGSYEHHIEIID